MDRDYLEALSFVPSADRHKVQTWLKTQWQAYPGSTVRAWHYGIFPIVDQSLVVVRAIPLDGQEKLTAIPWQRRTAPANLRGGLLYMPNKTFRWLGDLTTAAIEQQATKQLSQFGKLLHLTVTGPIAVSIQRAPRTYVTQAWFLEFELVALKGVSPGIVALLLNGIGDFRYYGLGFVVEEGLILDMVRAALFRQ